MKLLLFDIDGTLLRTNGLGRNTVRPALARYFGREVSLEGVSFSGKTDPQIFRELVTRVTPDPDAVLDAVMAVYQEEVHRQIVEAQVEALAGTLALLARLAARDDVQLALLTGNLRSMAYLKLQHAGFDGDLFPFGAFGCDAEDRNRLPAIAAERALQHTGRPFRGREVVVIGDTPRDIACGRHFGATTVAVATGHSDRNALAQHAPDVLLDSLEDADAALLA